MPAGQLGSCAASRSLVRCAGRCSTGVCANHRKLRPSSSRTVGEASHGLDGGALNGSDKLVLRQVHDALTGKLVDSYQISRVKDESVKVTDPF